MMRGILRDTFLEIKDRKALIIYGVFTVLGILGVMVSRSSSISISTNGEEIAPEIAGLVWTGVNTFVWFLYAMSIFSVIGLIPRMLERGRAEFYLSKPISRDMLFANKLISVWLIYSFLIIASSLIVIGVAALIHSPFEPGIFLSPLIHVGIFAVWLIVIGLFGILTGSQTTTIILVVSLWIAQMILSGYENFLKLFDSEVIKTTVTALYYILPKSTVIGGIGRDLIFGKTIESWEPVWTTALFALTAYLAALAFFRRKSF
jgi:ABC-type transport system involved in multi-copper enzyme maturation permease subunit